MTDALSGKTLLTASLAFLFALSALMAIGVYVTQVSSACDSSGITSLVDDVQQYHSPEGCGYSSSSGSSTIAQ